MATALKLLERLRVHGRPVRISWWDDVMRDVAVARLTCTDLGIAGEVELARTAYDYAEELALWLAADELGDAHEELVLAGGSCG